MGPRFVVDFSVLGWVGTLRVVVIIYLIPQLLRLRWTKHNYAVGHIRRHPFCHLQCNSCLELKYSSNQNETSHIMWHGDLLGDEHFSPCTFSAHAPASGDRSQMHQDPTTYDCSRTRPSVVGSFYCIHFFSSPKSLVNLFTQPN